MKDERLRVITDLISRKPIKTQAELIRELRALGVRTTQATISRDLEELGLFKDRKTGVYRLAIEAPVEDTSSRVRRTVADYVRSIEVSGNLVVIKTTPGGAQGVASAIDQLNWTEVIGTVAGDDTILIVAGDKAAGSKTAKRLKKIKGREEIE